jgi:hypothetical protein
VKIVSGRGDQEARRELVDAGESELAQAWSSNSLVVWSRLVKGTGDEGEDRYGRVITCAAILSEPRLMKVTGQVNWTDIRVKGSCLGSYLTMSRHYGSIYSAVLPSIPARTGENEKYGLCVDHDFGAEAMVLLKPGGVHSLKSFGQGYSHPNQSDRLCNQLRLLGSPSNARYG